MNLIGEMTGIEACSLIENLIQNKKSETSIQAECLKINPFLEIGK